MSGITIGVVVLGVIVLLIIIIAINRSSQQKSNQSFSADSFNATIANELSSGIGGESLIEILGLENLPADGQKEIITTATKVIEKRCLNHILDNLNEQEIEDFANALNDENPIAVQNFLQSKGLDLSTILQEEVLRFKDEAAKRMS